MPIVPVRLLPYTSKPRSIADVFAEQARLETSKTRRVDKTDAEPFAPSGELDQYEPSVDLLTTSLLPTIDPNGNSGDPALLHTLPLQAYRPAIPQKSDQQAARLHPYQLDTDRGSIPVQEDSLDNLSMRPTMTLAAIAQRRDIDSPTIPMMALTGIVKQQNAELPAMESEISGAAGGAAIVGIGNIAGSVLKFGSNYLLQVGFGASLYGLYSVSLSIVFLIGSLFNLGMDNAMVRYTSIYQSKRQNSSLRGLMLFCTSIAGFTGLLGALLLFFLAPWLAHINHQTELVPIMQLMAPMIPLLCLQDIWYGALQGFKAFKGRIIAERLLPPIVLILLIGAALLLAPTAPSLVLASTISMLTGTLASLFFVLRTLNKIMRGEAERYELGEWFSFATFNFLTAITEIILESIDTLLLAIFVVASTSIGYYTAAVKFSDFIAMPLFSLNTMFAPTIAELHSKNEQKKLTTMFQVVTRWTITFSLPIFCVVTIFSKPLLGLSGSTFSEAWPLLVVSAIGTLFNAATGSTGYMLLMTGHERLSFINSLASVVLNILCSLWLIPLYGAMGVAIATSAILILMNFVRLIEVRIILKCQPFSWRMLKPIGAALISGGITGILLFLLSHANRFLQLSLIPVFLVGYIGLLVLFKTDPEDQVVVDKLGKKFLRKKIAKRS